MSGAAAEIRLADVLRDGRHVILREEAGLADDHAAIHDEVIDAVGRLAGDAARARLERDGLEVLHEVLPAGDIGGLRDEVMPRVRPRLLTATCRVAREVLGIDGEFFVDDYTILRVNFPYEVALRAPKQAENPGIGRMSENARRDASAAKVVDPVYNPRGYHRGQPPAAWAHGPHLDTWTGHSRDGVNLWWAIGDVVAENSMFFYFGLFDTPLEPDPTSLYLKAGQPLPQPTPMPLAGGEMIVFNPEVLHGTHLNVSGRTRVAASMRINARPPEFDPTCFYAREFWHSSTDLEAGRFDEIVRFPRAENLAEAAPSGPSRRTAAPPRIRLPRPLTAGDWTDVCAAADVPRRGKLVLESDDGTPVVLLLDTAAGPRAIGARCPHLGTCLSDGFHDDRFIHCPAHAVRFAVETGESVSPLLSLPVGDVREDGGRLLVRLTP
jgi:nitrite reductase/ring-hydroxylating ferredoxin subunit